MVSFAFLGGVEFLDDPQGEHTLIAESGVEGIKEVVDIWIDGYYPFFFDPDDFVEQLLEHISQILISIHEIVLHVLN